MKQNEKQFTEEEALLIVNGKHPDWEYIYNEYALIKEKSFGGTVWSRLMKHRPTNTIWCVFWSTTNRAEGCDYCAYAKKSRRRSGTK